MSGHEVPIGQEWADTSDRVRDIMALAWDELGDDVHAYRRVVAYFIGFDPVRARAEILLVAHERGRHAVGKCPEHCPEF